MKTLICKECGMEFEVDEKWVTEDYIQCPNPDCGYMCKNPLRR